MLSISQRYTLKNYFIIVKNAVTMLKNGLVEVATLDLIIYDISVMCTLTREPHL